MQKMDTKQFRKHGHEMVDWIADFMDNIEKYRVHPDIQPGEIKAKLPKEAPIKGEEIYGIDTALDLDNEV